MSRDGPECTAGWKTRAFIVARVGNGELSKYLHAIVRHRGEGNRSDRPEVSAEFATKHRAAVARVVYLAQDGLDLGVADSEREGDDERLKRVARYLHGQPDYLQWYPTSRRHGYSCFDHGCRLGHKQSVNICVHHIGSIGFVYLLHLSCVPPS